MSTLGVLGVCLALAAGLPPGAEPTGRAQAARFQPVQRFTLAWTHSIEKIRWEEDYRVHRTADGQPRLALEMARIRGTGAGMEPPPGARLQGGWYEYVPADQPQGALRLTRSPYTADYDWCVDGQCTSLGTVLPTDGGVTLVWPCAEARP